MNSHMPLCLNSSFCAFAAVWLCALAASGGPSDREAHRAHLAAIHAAPQPSPSAMPDEKAFAAMGEEGRRTLTSEAAETIKRIASAGTCSGREAERVRHIFSLFAKCDAATASDLARRIRTIQPSQLTSLETVRQTESLLRTCAKAEGMDNATFDRSDTRRALIRRQLQLMRDEVPQ